MRLSEQRVVPSYIMSRGSPRLSVRVSPDQVERVEALARDKGCTVSDVFRKALAVYTEEVGSDAVLIPLTLYYRDQLLIRLQNYSGRRPREVRQEFLVRALDGAWF